VPLQLPLHFWLGHCLYAKFMLQQLQIHLLEPPTIEHHVDPAAATISQRSQNIVSHSCPDRTTCCTMINNKQSHACWQVRMLQLSLVLTQQLLKHGCSVGCAHHTSAPMLPMHTFICMM
jgi:hypothetical protein